MRTPTLRPITEFYRRLVLRSIIEDRGRAARGSLLSLFIVEPTISRRQPMAVFAARRPSPDTSGGAGV